MFRSPKNDWYHTSKNIEDAKWRIQYHGTAGFTLQTSQTTLVLDPFVTRPTLLQTGLKPLVPNQELVHSVFPRADAVLVGHSHHDHILDAPEVCLHTGAKFIGSPDSVNVARAAGVPEGQLLATQGREDIPVEAAIVRGVPSRHGKVYAGRIPLPGNITSPPPWPPRLRDLRHGQVLNWHVQLDGLNVVHIDTADLIDAEFAGLQADVVCLCAIGRRYRPNYVASVVQKLNPTWIIPCHWDWFFTPYQQPPKLLPGVDLGGFIQEIADHNVQPVVLPIDGQFVLSQNAIPI